VAVLIVSVESAKESGSILYTGPIRDSTTGNSTSPWKRPNITVSANTLKNVMKTWEEEKLHNTRARKVVRPPLKTAGPMVDMDSRAFLCLVPEISRIGLKKI